MCFHHFIVTCTGILEKAGTTNRLIASRFRALSSVAEAYVSSFYTEFHAQAASLQNKGDASKYISLIIMLIYIFFFH